MRLIKVTIENYRCHRALTVEFSNGLTVIEGANESGKSTMIEAIHRALFLRSKTTGQVLEAMRSDGGGYPKVEVEIEAGGKKVLVNKHFAGAKGTTTVTVQGEGVLKDDQAEARLAEILGVAGMAGGGGAAGALEKRWAHLWVVQGRSGWEPTGELGEVGTALVDRLQEMGGGGAVQSRLDRQIREKVRQEVEALVKGPDRQPRANTRWANLRATVKGLEQKEKLLASEVQSLQEAMTKRQQADRRLGELKTEIAQAEAELEVTKTQREKVIHLCTVLKDVVGQKGIKQAEHQRVVKQLAELAEAEAAIPRLESERAEAASEEAEARGALQLIEQQVSEAEAALSQAQAARDCVRLRRDFALAHEAQQRAQAEVARVEGVRAEIAEASQRLVELRTRLAGLPAITPTILTRMQELRDEEVGAKAAEQAMSTGVRVLQGCPGLTVGGSAVEERQELRFLGPFEIQVNGSLHLQVSPGGGSKLEEAVATRQRASSALQETLQRHGVTSLESAREALVQRQVLEQEVQAEEKRLQAAGAGKIEETREKAMAELVRARARMEALQSVIKEAGEGRGDDAALQEAETVFEQRKAECAALQQRLAEVADRSKRAESKLREAMDRQRDAVTRRETLISVAGTKDVLEKRQAELEGELAAVESQVASMEEQLKQLGANLLDEQVEMLERAVESLSREAQAMRLRQAEANALLVRDGTRDPFSELSAVREEQATAIKMLAAEETRVKGWLRLLRLFEEEEARLEKQFTGPLMSCVKGYVAPVFGANSTVETSYHEGSFQGLVLDRTALGLGTWPFDKLSAGAREQLGVAFRLAVAEVLAKRHDGCLPVVLDDAFVNSDPIRLKGLHLMIHRATKQGLQIILLTCSPADYSSLGADKVHLGRVGASLPP